MAASADSDGHPWPPGRQRGWEQFLVYTAALEDLVAAADLFRPTWEATAGVDGYVSLEVPPGLAYDVQASIEVARRLHAQAGRPNRLIKIPGPRPGLSAMEPVRAPATHPRVSRIPVLSQPCSRFAITSLGSC